VGGSRASHLAHTFCTHMATGAKRTELKDIRAALYVLHLPLYEHSRCFWRRTVLYTTHVRDRNDEKEMN
jgi:hypothetical protein